MGGTRPPFLHNGILGGNQLPIKNNVVFKQGHLERTLRNVSICGRLNLQAQATRTTMSR